MKKIIFLLLFLVIPQLANANTYIEKKIWEQTFKVIKYDLSSKEYEIKVVKTDDATNLRDLMKQNNAITWVNGVFFCPTDYDWCNTSRSFTDNERYIQWQKYATYLTTWDRAVFWWTKEKIPFIYQSWKINMDDEDKIYYWLWNYPLLLNEWKSMLEEYWDKWLIDAKMRVRATRNFICSDKEKKNIYFWLVYNATIDELAISLLDFGCYDALNLDAWLSTVFMYNNRYLVWPQKRDILDAVVIERKWLEMEKIYKAWELITKVLLQDSIKRWKNNSEKTLKYIDKYIDSLTELRIKWYEKSTKDIFQTNIVWELDKVWYEINVKSLKNLKLILTINEVLENLKIAKSEIKNG